MLIIFSVVFLPVLSLVFFNFWTVEDMQKKDAQKDAQKDAMFFAQQIFIHHQRLEGETRSLFSVLGETFKLYKYKLEGESCQKLMQEILKQNKNYTNIGIAGPDGQILCSGLPEALSLNVYYRPYFQKMLNERQFVSGDYTVGAVTGKPTMPFLQPVFDSSDQLESALFAFHDLSCMKELSNNDFLPDGVSFLIVDGDGIILNCFLEGEECIGKNINSTTLGKSVLGKKDKGVFRAAGADGIEKTYSFAPLFSGADELNKKDRIYIIVGVKDKIILSHYTAYLAPFLVLFLAAAIMAWLVAKKECSSCYLQNIKSDSAK